MAESDRSALLRHLSLEPRLQIIVRERAGITLLASLFELDRMERDGLIVTVEGRVRLTPEGLRAQRALVKSDLDDWKEAQPKSRAPLVVAVLVVVAAVLWWIVR